MNPEKIAGTVLSTSLAIIILGTAFYLPYYGDAAKPEGHNETYENLAAYLNGQGEIPKDFSEKEKSHLADVKSLLGWFRIIFYAAVLAGTTATVYLYKKEETLRNAIAVAGYAALGFITLMGATALINFEFFWNNIFHPLLFPQGNWMFPQDSLLIQMFPRKAFEKFAYLFLGLSALFSSLIIGIKKWTE